MNGWGQKNFSGERGRNSGIIRIQIRRLRAPGYEWPQWFLGSCITNHCLLLGLLGVKMLLEENLLSPPLPSSTILCYKTSQHCSWGFLIFREPLGSLERKSTYLKMVRNSFAPLALIYETVQIFGGGSTSSPIVQQIWAICLGNWGEIVNKLVRTCLTIYWLVRQSMEMSGMYRMASWHGISYHVMVWHGMAWNEMEWKGMEGGWGEMVKSSREGKVCIYMQRSRCSASKSLASHHPSL